MTKVLSCRDVGVDCDWVVRAETEEEIMRKSAEHARKEHGLTEITPEMEKNVRAAIRDESLCSRGSAQKF